MDNSPDILSYLKSLINGPCHFTLAVCIHSLVFSCTFKKSYIVETGFYEWDWERGSEKQTVIDF